MYYVDYDQDQSKLVSERIFYFNRRIDANNFVVLYSTNRILSAMTFARYLNDQVPDTRHLRGMHVDLFKFYQLDTVFNVYPVLELIYLWPITGQTEQVTRERVNQHLGLLMLVGSFLLRYPLTSPFVGQIAAEDITETP